MLRRCDAAAAFDGDIKGLRFEAVGEDEDVAKVLSPGSCDDGGRVKRCDFCLDEF